MTVRSAAPLPVATTEPPTILVVDDTRDNLAMLGQLLRPQYRVRVANSGHNALRALATPPRPDLILLDVMMPDLDGHAVLARIRAMPECADLPVIFVTALDATEDEAKGFQLGAADYITKPVRPAIVRARVACQLELKQARDRLKAQNGWLEAEVERRMAENQLIQDTSLRALASLAETRDNETGNHILRTQGYVEVLCRALAEEGTYRAQLDEERIGLITKAAPLHDIGKVGIPDSILLKAGKLTPEEWVVMRTHTTLGAEAIRRAIGREPGRAVFGFLRTAIEIALAHHEKWDGSGYPSGLSGQAIPLAGRVMAVADVFDALLHRRVYKDAIPSDEARRILVEGRGTHFDPLVLDTFLSRYDDMCAIAAEYRDEPHAPGSAP